MPRGLLKGRTHSHFSVRSFEHIAWHTEDPQYIFIHLNQMSTLPASQTQSDTRRGVLPLKIPPKLCRQKALVLLQTLCKFPSSHMILSPLLKLASESAHLYWKWVERGLVNHLLSEGVPCRGEPCANFDAHR